MSPYVDAIGDSKKKLLFLAVVFLTCSIILGGAQAGEAAGNCDPTCLLLLVEGADRLRIRQERPFPT